MNSEKRDSIILIVDDHPINLKVLFTWLSDSGFRVLVANSGESALQKLKKVLPDIILLDVLMPGINGFETCQKLQESEETKHIPVIFMTALSDSVDKVKGLSLGAVDYITKPFQPEEVLARVKLHLRLHTLTKTLAEKNAQLEREAEERLRSEQKIREQAALLDITADAILVRDLENKILFWNKGAERLYGWRAEEAIGEDVDRLLRGDRISELPELQKSLNDKPSSDRAAARSEWLFELHQVTKQGKHVIVASRWTLVRDEGGQAKSILIVNTDITEKKQLEAQFLRAQRHESIGTLASGIAHDLNNALTPILASVQLLQRKIHDEQSLRLLTIMERNVRRSADLIKQVLSFARGVEGERSTLQVRQLIEEIEQIIKQTFSKMIEIRTEISAADSCTISGDATQLHQVLMNLCVNARDAMPEGGILTISARTVWIDAEIARMNLDAKVGFYAVISVSDTGTGISEEILARMFDPFFTTKEHGKGTGLGLSTAIGIIKSHEGFVEVESALGKGTQFKIYLPASQRKATEVMPEVRRELLAGRGEVILAVDDEEFILETVKTALENFAYKVLTAESGIEAVTLYAQHKEEISAVVVDMMMPGMDGLNTIRSLQQINPQVKIIAVSGLGCNYQMGDILQAGVKKFLSKPYTPDELLKDLQFVLAGDAV